MKTAIIGYGKMGRELEKELNQKGHSILATFNSSNIDTFLDSHNQDPFDLAFEFTSSEGCEANIMTCLENGIPVVSGTNGIEPHLSQIIQKCHELNGTMIYSPNYALGWSIFTLANKYLAELMNRFADYDVSIMETHDSGKKEKPSSGAIVLSDLLLNSVDRKDSWRLDRNQVPEELRVECSRKGNVPGRHNVKYDSRGDVITFSHACKNNKGYARGAIVAAEYILGKKGIFTMEDVLALP